MRRLFTSLVFVCAASAAASQVPPLQVPIGEAVEGIACATDPTQTYTLYIPSTYTDGRRWPVLLVFDPRGRSLLAAELFRDAAESYGWIIVSSDNTRSDESWEPNLKAIEALWPEIHVRLPVDTQRIYATGFSGGVAVATLLARSTGEVTGIIGCGGLDEVNHLDDSSVAFFLTAGRTDFNLIQMQRLDDFLAERGNPHRLVIFDGPHTWMPSGVAREAVEWMEIIAMRQGTRDPDQGMIEELYAKNTEQAEMLAAEGEVVAALRRFREMERTYDGLHDTSEAKQFGDRIESSREFRAQLKRMRRARSYENACLDRGVAGIALIRNSDVPPPTRQIAGTIRLRDLMKNADASGEKGRAAERCLNSLYANLSFYLPLMELPNQRYAHVATSYELSLIIRDDNPVVWYNLACARALSGQTNIAMEAFAEALEHGFANRDLLATDSDLDALRDRDDFKALLASLSD